MSNASRFEALTRRSVSLILGRVAGKEAPISLDVRGRAVQITNPSKLYFTQANVKKLDIVEYYLAVADGAVAGIRGRPIVLKRFVDGAEGEAFYQKRAPSNKPAWLDSVVLSFPSGRTAEEIVVNDAAGLIWIVNLGCMELHPHAVRAADLLHPDELRIDLDPGPGVPWADVRKVALEVNALLSELGLVGWPKTTGSRGIHVNVRIEPRWPFAEVRRAALAIAREIERRAPTIATSKWWKEERKGVFLDYNQNAKDRTTSSAYSIRPLPDARVSAPLAWAEVADCEPGDFTVKTMPARYARLGDLWAEMDGAVGSLDAALDLAFKDEASGLADAPWPPHYARQAGEERRVAPSRKRKDPSAPKTAAPGVRKGVTQPLIIVSKAKKKEDAVAGLERWKAKYPAVAALLAVDDVLTDTMRGRSSAWTRIRVNLRHVPEAERPPQETPDPDYDAASEWGF
jgi:bifunctional non-homologous end joining protein LigD